jgi:hypothetical protein
VTGDGTLARGITIRAGSGGYAGLRIVNYNDGNATDYYSYIRPCGGSYQSLCISPGRTLAGEAGTLMLGVDGQTKATVIVGGGVGGNGLPAGQASTTDRFQVNSITGTNRFIVTDSGSVGIGTSTPVTNLQVTAGNATTTVTIGKIGAGKGSCLELYDVAGTVVYASVAAGASTFTLSSTSCK